MTTASSTTTSSTTTRAFSRKNRVYVMRDFLLAEYQDLLSTPDSVILDVAGGKGDLSWLLTNNIHPIQSIVIDPRITKSQHILKSIAYLRQHPEEAQERAKPGRPSHQPLASLLPFLPPTEDLVHPRHLRLLVDASLVDAVRTYLEARDHGTAETERLDRWGKYWQDAQRRAQQATPLGYVEDNESNNSLTGETVDAQQALEWILSAKLVVGFHPDQATDFCIELANDVLKIPFCVVPCCVFPSEFTHRKQKDDTRVRTYEQLIDYLCRKVPHIRIAHLAFHETATARNIVLYTRPGETDQNDKNEKATHVMVHQKSLLCEPTKETIG